MSINHQITISIRFSGRDADKFEALLKYYSTKLTPTRSSLVKYAIRELYKQMEHLLPHKEEEKIEEKIVPSASSTPLMKF